MRRRDMEAAARLRGDAGQGEPPQVTGRLVSWHVVLERDCGGLASEGTGDTLEEAYRAAANGQNLDWGGAPAEMRDRDCEGMMHL